MQTVQALRKIYKIEYRKVNVPIRLPLVLLASVENKGVIAVLQVQKQSKAASTTVLLNGPLTARPIVLPKPALK